ncbi:endonuclease III domain-containing protein [Antarcticirhabdus aurantiaca]|uniref:Endonuclease III n=1 Tax=Antarcticirhabdus aurantiaca TaxID=2606717 RepID=A0ACD4NS61_9HYPH|nr:endonuclease III [Antarcticirhabdus aurantiaca]WAJ29562.1 endonuclease III [Jeongeuplla avenae]
MSTPRPAASARTRKPGARVGAEAEGLLPPDEVEEAFRRLKAHMPGRAPGAKGPKDHRDPFRSVVSCILSAQSLDRNTAKAADALFALAKTPQALLALPEDEIARAIKPCGLYNTKARNLKRMAQALLDEHGGVVPQTREGLMSLPGVGRKCADIVMSFTFDADVIAVDTHVHRVSNRIGLTRSASADGTADGLAARAPVWAQTDGHFWLIQFGKAVCLGRRPRCESCFLTDLCLWFSANRA